MRIALQITLAVLTVFGFYFLLKVFNDAVFPQRSMLTAIMIDEKKQLESLDILLQEARSALSLRRRIAVLIPRNVLSKCNQAEKEELCETIDAFHAELYVI